jgi:hypothetical protein
MKNDSGKRKGKKKLIYRARTICPGWSYQPRLKGTLWSQLVTPRGTKELAPGGITNQD